MQSETQYAFINDGVVTNTALFENPTEELLEHFRVFHDADLLVECPSYFVEPGWEYDGTYFWGPSPYPSWIKDFNTGTWSAPVPIPTKENAVFEWDESLLTWFELRWDETLSDWVRI